MRQIESGSYEADASSQRKGALVGFDVAGATHGDQGTRAAACHGAFLGMVRALNELVDRLLALRHLTESELRVPPGVSSEEALVRFVEEALEDTYQRVATDSRLKAPQKVRDLCATNPPAAEAACSLYALRRCLEHQGGTPRREIAIQLLQHRIFVGKNEVFALPVEAKGEKVGVEVAPEPRVFPKGEPIRLSEDDIERLYLTLDAWIGPELARAAGVAASSQGAV